MFGNFKCMLEICTEPAVGVIGLRWFINVYKKKVHIMHCKRLLKEKKKWEVITEKNDDTSCSWLNHFPKREIPGGNSTSRTIEMTNLHNLTFSSNMLFLLVLGFNTSLNMRRFSQEGLYIDRKLCCAARTTDFASTSYSTGHTVNLKW